MLLPAKTDTILKERCYKNFTIKFFCSGDSKMVFTLLTKVIVGHIFITLINVVKMCLKKRSQRPSIVANLASITA